MKVNELRDFLNSLPEWSDEFPVVNGEYFVPEGEIDFQYRVDKPILALIVDENTHEVVFLHEFTDLKEPFIHELAYTEE